MATDLLFYSIDSSQQMEGQRAAMADAIAKYGSNQLLNSNVDDLVQKFSSEFGVELPVLLVDEMTADQGEAQIDVSRDRNRMIFDRNQPFYITGTRITVWVPFSGEAICFQMRPNRWDSMPPRAQINGQSLQFSVQSTNLDGPQVKATIDAWLATVQKYLEWLHHTWKGFDSSLAEQARQLINSRREKLLRDQDLVAGLGIPLRPRTDAPRTFVASEVRAKVLPKLPTPSAAPYRPEPVMEEAVYQNILGIMEGMVHVMERSPKAFHNLDEEGVRTHFLMQLNGQYQGSATGETFNNVGKTDILVRSGDRNIFIAECKFWGGPSTISETIDQLLGYLTWRDAKTAIVLFNRNKDFSRVVEQIPELVKTHPNFRKDLGAVGESSFRYVMRNKDDASKDIAMTVMAFDVPRPPEPAT